MRHYVLLSVLASAVAGACASGLQRQKPMQAGQVASQEKYLLDVTLASGLYVHHVMYRREPLGGRKLLQIKRQLGVTILSRAGETMPSLSEKELDDLMSGLLKIIHQSHHDQLDSIQIDLTLVDPLWRGAVKHLKEAAIAPDYTVDPKAKIFLDAMQSYLSESSLVKRICEQVATIERRCKKHAVSMNPIVFLSPHLWKKWGKVKYLPNAGIDKESIWFAIDLAEQ